MVEDITLQINLSPGDVNYAELTVPALVEKHPDIKKRLLVVDCCRPQKTKLLDPDVRFPITQFEANVEKITAISKRLLAANLVTDVYYLKPNDPIINHISKKYLRNLYKDTHGAGGTANMSYWLGFDLPDTKYVLHYDGDVLLYQKPGFNWVDEAIQHFKDNDNILIAVPRLCPPVEQDVPSLHEGRPTINAEHYWLNDWFSTRYLLLNKQRLEKYLPIVRGKLMTELLLRKYGNKAFPLDPEIMLFKSAGSRGAKRMVLKNEDAWLLHPVVKSPDYLNALPQMIASINRGDYPEAQKGFEDIKLDAWLEFLKVN